MYWCRRATTIVATLVSLSVARTSDAQEFAAPPGDPPIQAGPVVLAPVISLSNFGHDSNVFNLNDDANPQSDVTATLSPAIQAWLRLAHARVAARSQYNFYYYRDLTYLRATDYQNGARLDVPLSRFTPFISGELSSTRPDVTQNVELSPVIRRKLNSWSLGTGVKLSERTSIEVYGMDARFDYESDATNILDIATQVLDYDSKSLVVAGKYAVTPLTSVGVETAYARDRFDSESTRDADTLRVTPFVEFSPSALISGRAVIGFQQRHMVSGDVPDYNDTYLSADLTYTLLERTRFNVAASRSLQYSFFGSLTDYVQTGLTLNVSHRLNEFWDVGGSFGRDRIHYRPIAPEDERPDETILISSATAGYTIRQARFGFNLEYRQRDAASTVAFRGYSRLRTGASATYTF
jgi:putative beta-barrel porin BBP2